MVITDWNEEGRLDYKVAIIMTILLMFICFNAVMFTSGGYRLFYLVTFGFSNWMFWREIYK